jgi:hypothetical protein
MNKEVIQEKGKAVKTHFKKNKKYYITGAVCFVSGVAVAIILKQNDVASQKVENIALLNWKPFNFLHQEVIVELPGRGHRGCAIVRNSDGAFWGSINKTAQEIGCSATHLRNHLAGFIPEINGETYTNMGENLSGQVKIAA